MSEQVLSDDEKSALLDGVSSGAVEVQSADGPQYASVKPFVIGPRARIVSNSFPRLDGMNAQLATKVSENVATLLQAEVEVSAGVIHQKLFADYCELWPARSLAIGFSAEPLAGNGMLIMDSVLVAPLVEAFFSGNCPEAVASTDTAHSPGAISIAHLFSREVLSVLHEVWLPLRELSVERTFTQVGLELVESIGPGDTVIASEFEVSIGEENAQRGAFSIVWNAATVAPLRAALEGKPRDRNAAEDQRWEQALRRRLADVVVDLSSNVGHARMNLGDLVKLVPGDVIGIDTPRVATVLAHGIPLLEGRFGVQAGRNAVEAVAWLAPQTSN